MNWIQRKIHLYNVTFGLYMLDWWEHCTFNILVSVLMCFVLRYITRFFKSISSAFLASVFMAAVFKTIPDQHENRILFPL